ncbi:UDP-N-acetylmuramate dehydrogenase [Candidatus Uhrbacteria bacterium]|nr:UDP-N-acetylmuramate dehydrogenase [Candidatus Uhrbacteria bacterium]
MDFAAMLAERFGARAKKDEPLAKHLNFRIGGPARYFVEAQSSQDIIDAVRMAKDAGVPFFVLGGGSNTLASDKGFDGLLVKAANRGMKIDGTRVIAEAGVIAAAVARATAQAGLRGFEWAISLPGTIGGGVRGNAGCFGGEMKDAVESVRVLHDGELKTLHKNELGFAYRHSMFKEPGNADVVLDATLALKKGDAAEAMAQLEKNLAGRKASQPLGSSSAGCMFKNVEYTDESEIAKLAARYPVPPEMLARKRIASGWIIDQLGLKGTRVGDAMVSETHGNFLVNKGNATADEIVQLIALIKTRVRNEAGIQLHEEVQYLGFSL